MERLRAGYCEWQNPFNANQRQIVSFAETKAIVFWSKNPAPLIPHLDEIGDMGKKFYFQFTLNDYESEGLEPGIPALETRIATFAHLAPKYPVIWRYDPIVFGDRLTMNRHLQIVERLMHSLGEFTDKLVFSFVDLYGRVASYLGGHNSELRAPTLREMADFSGELTALRDKIAPHLKLATCAETDIDFATLGIEKNSCIDPALINELCGHEIFKKKRARKSGTQLSLVETPASKKQPAMIFEKDKGQREACQCAPSKDIGSYRTHPCKHRCVYCYAGHARKAG